MAREKNASKQSSTALTHEEENDNAALAELTDFFDTVDIDGMADVEGDDLKLSFMSYNMKGVDESGDPYPLNVYVDSISRQQSKTIQCVLLVTKKTLRWSSYNNNEKKTETHCQSADRVTGTMADGTQRPCKSCPDNGWFRDEAGKPTRKCGPVHTVVAVDRLTSKPFMVRFKNTGLRPWRDYLMQHHWGARKDKQGRRANIPLFAYSMTLGLKMHESGNYSTPTFTRGEILSRIEVKEMYESAKAYLEMIGDVLVHADKVEAKQGADATERDPNLNADDFADGDDDDIEVTTEG